MTIQQFYEKYPQQSKKIKGREFVYRYYKNEKSKATLVLLTGGLGLSDLFYNHFDRFTQDFSVLTFDYLICYKTMADFADAVAELLKELDEKVWLVGQSMGGAAAQIITKRHPEYVDGLVLSNTVALQNQGGSLQYFEGMKKRQGKSYRMMKWMPFGLVKSAMMKAIRQKSAGVSQENQEELNQMTNIVWEMLTKKYQLHMIRMLLDCGKHLEMERKDFAFLEDRVLLILAEDDKTFTPQAREQLVEMMTNPTTVNEMGGGHLGALMDIENYAKTVTEYIKDRTVI